MNANKTIQKLEMQLQALEHQKNIYITNNKPTCNIFAITGKINKVKKQIDEIKKFQYLAI